MDTVTLNDSENAYYIVFRYKSEKAKTNASA